MTEELMSMTVADALAAGLIQVVKPQEPKGELSRLVESLLMDGTLTYKDILEAVRSEFPNANTTNKSIASVASVMRRKGHEVPKRVMY